MDNPSAMALIISFIAALLAVYIAARRNGGAYAPSIREKIAVIEYQHRNMGKKIEEIEDDIANIEYRVSNLERATWSADQRGERVGQKERGEKIHVLVVMANVSDINVKASVDAMYAAGIDYDVLSGDRVEKAEIYNALTSGRYNVLQVDSHGERVRNAGIGLSGGIMLSNGEWAETGWWVRSVKDAEAIRMVALLACDSVDIAEQIYYICPHVKHAIGVRGEISDKDAVEFTYRFYINLARLGMEKADRAFNIARYGMTKEEAEKMVIFSR